MTDKENKGWIKFVPSLDLPKERVSIAYDTHDERKVRYAYGYFQFHNGTCTMFWKDGNERPMSVKAKDILYWMPIPGFDSMSASEEEPTPKDIMGKSGIGYCPTTGIGVKIMSRKEYEWTESDKISDYDHKADVDAAMAELAEQCRKFTEEYKKSADDILAEMRGEEPVSNPIDFEKELYKAFGQVKDFTLGMRIAKWFYDMGKNSQEPVSEDLEEESDKYAAAVCQLMVINGNDDDDSIEEYLKQAFKAGAQWQKRKDEYITENLGEYINEISKQFPEVSFAKLSRIAVRVAKWQREQIMKDAVEGYIERDKGGQLILGRTNLEAGDEFMLLDASTFHDIKCGDRRKAKIMIIIKED